jgi:hypothetical protein
MLVVSSVARSGLRLGEISTARHRTKVVQRVTLSSGLISSRLRRAAAKNIRTSVNDWIKANSAGGAYPSSGLPRHVARRRSTSTWCGLHQGGGQAWHGIATYSTLEASENLLRRALDIVRKVRGYSPPAATQDGGPSCRGDVAQRSSPICAP